MWSLKNLFLQLKIRQEIDFNNMMIKFYGITKSDSGK
jgi:hypothetical protein